VRGIVIKINIEPDGHKEVRQWSATKCLCMRSETVATVHTVNLNVGKLWDVRGLGVGAYIGGEGLKGRRFSLSCGMGVSSSLC
jgi:hypothetical protein